ncbi:MAG: uroporphyrinogen decarboxylase family protein [Promethearchaeota archaeon]
MDPTERALTVLRGEIPDRVPVFCAGIEDRTFYEVLGRPLVQNSKILRNRFVRWYLNRSGAGATGLLQRTITKGMKRRIRAQVILGFDAVWGLYDETFIGRDSETMLRYSGSLYKLVEDGHGNMSYYYVEPAIHSREQYESWPYWPDPDALARRTFKFYAEMVRRYGKRTCIFGQGPHYGIFESLMWTLGLGKMSYWIRREPDLVQDFVEKFEAIMEKCMSAMMDAGVRVILQTDDMGFKTGPIMAPELLDKLFGPSYTRLAKLVHERGCYYVQHSCGDNTDLFEYFVKWGFDGVHSLENTSSVDPLRVKKEWGDKLTLIGGTGIDYLLSEESSDEEVVEDVVRFLREMGPGGRFIAGPVHSESTVPARKLRLLVDTVRKHGEYPLV